MKGEKIIIAFVTSFLIIGFVVFADMKLATRSALTANTIGSTATEENEKTGGFPWGIHWIDSRTLVPREVEEIPDHLLMPNDVRAIYLSGWTAGNTTSMQRIYQLLDETRITAVVIDIKDASGKLSYRPSNLELALLGVGTNRIKDIEALIEKLHAKNIYVIGRLQVFQDPFYAKLFPSEAYKNINNGEVWQDYKGSAWLRADSQKVWDYTVTIAHDAYKKGFDEINVDYVRFPSDGDLSALDRSGFVKNRPETIRDFFQFLDQEIRGHGIPLSADVFGLTTSATGDLGIGQVFEYIVPYVDAIAPMIYPSHYAPGTFGFLAPAEHPSEIVTKALLDAQLKLSVFEGKKTTIRPWLQDFDLLNVPYGESEVRGQIEAAEAIGVTSWMLWDAKNIYTPEAFLR